MATHTPAPWVILPREPEVGDDGELTGAFVYPGGVEGDDGNPVCMFGDPSGSGTMFENEADHRLIAAAPDLFAELADVSQMIDGVTDAEKNGATIYFGPEDIAALRAAIAKAATP